MENEQMSTSPDISSHPISSTPSSTPEPREATHSIDAIDMSSEKPLDLSFDAVQELGKKVPSENVPVKDEKLPENVINDQKVAVKKDEKLTESEPEAPKSLKARAGDKELDIPLDAKVDVTTKAGKKAEVSVEELKNDYWGKQEISRRMTDMDLKSKANEKQLKFADSILKELPKLKGFERVNHILSNVVRQFPEIADDMVAYNRQLYQEITELQKMDEASRDRFFLQKENESLKSNQQKELEVRHQNQKAQYFQDKDQAIRDKFKLSDEEIAPIGAQLMQELERTNKLDTPMDEVYNMLADRVDNKVRVDSAITILKEVDPKKVERIFSKQHQDLSDPDVRDLVDLKEMLRHRPLKEVKDRAKALFGESQIVKEANEKVRKNEKVTGQKQVEKNIINNKKSKQQARPIESLYKWTMEL